MVDSKDILRRIEEALLAARQILRAYTPGRIAAKDKGGGDPVTEADRAVDAALKEILLQPGEGWLSEETVDDRSRLNHEVVWIVDPLDGTREFVAGIPEWAVSIGLVVKGRALAGGICNPQTGELIVGARDHGILYNGGPASVSDCTDLKKAVVLASRSETKRGEWARFESAPFTIKPTGSVAYKLGRVAAGQDDITWTLTPKNEWDVAAGVALVLAAGGFAITLDGDEPVFNKANTLLSGLIAGPTQLRGEIDAIVAPFITSG